jgi:WD40-like Beta Propeller Repeat
VTARRDREVARRLSELRAPGEPEAEERSWEVVRAAYADRTPIRPSPRNRRLVLALAAGAVLLAIGLSPAGAKVADLVSDVVDAGEPDARPQLRSLPASGELLVQSKDGPWIVREDGSKRLLGDYDEATWSPHGVYVAVADGRELAALEIDGDVRWTFPAHGVVSDPRWAGGSADTRIAYRSGDDLRVIAGDGSPESDHLIARDVASVAPAWRPIGYSKLGPPGAAGFVLSYLDGDKQVHTVNADTGEPVPTKPLDRELLTTPTIGQETGPARSPDGTAIAAIRPTRSGDQLSLHIDGRSEVLFRARGTLTGPAWSPDGRWLLIGWPAANQWLFIDTRHPRHVVAFDRISEQFGGGGFPQIRGWIFPER